MWFRLQFLQKRRDFDEVFWRTSPVAMFYLLERPSRHVPPKHRGHSSFYLVDPPPTPFLFRCGRKPVPTSTNLLSSRPNVLIYVTEYSRSIVWQFIYKKRLGDILSQLFIELSSFWENRFHSNLKSKKINLKQALWSKRPNLKSLDRIQNQQVDEWILVGSIINFLNVNWKWILVILLFLRKPSYVVQLKFDVESNWFLIVQKQMHLVEVNDPWKI